MRIDGLSDFIRDLEDGIQRTPQALENCVKRTTARIIRGVKLKTPVGKSTPSHTGGQLRREWHQKKINKFEYVVYNNVKYASYVENGHRIKNKSGEYVGFVDGRYMLKRTVDEVEQVLGYELRTTIEDIW
jgi:hypothetical protein